MVTRSVTRSVAQPVAIPFELAGSSLLRLAYRGASLALAFVDQHYTMGAIRKRPAAFAFSDLITFTRASGGGITNAQGVYEWLPADQPRIDYDPVTGEAKGLLIEEQRTRLNTRCSDFTGVTTRNLTATATGTTVGPLTETKLVPNTTTTFHELSIYAHAIDSVASVSSVIAKAGEYRYLVLTRKASYEGDNNNYARFDLVTGTVQADYTGGAKITQVGGGRYRCVIPAPNDSGLNSVFRVAVEADNFGTGYNKTAGDGTSGLYIYHAQCENGSFATSPIAGEGAQVTRAADIASVNELSPWFNPEQGTLFVEFVPHPAYPVAGKGLVAAQFGDGTYANRISLNSSTGNSNANFDVALDNNVRRTSAGQYAQGVNKIAGAYSLNEATSSLNGSPSSTTTLVAVPQVTRLYIGQDHSAAHINGHIRSLRFYPRKFSDSELQAMTQ